eukprot:TRINITY_DN5818_c0_g1_i3.p2 TRINITY_DN5818_c0_g1~~TRINITY_DN5818_c0_g1_i3.p2  ORF type:complete len:150 (+),score=44.83 TRINITY_DN5818_c0_g1_i3:416-865(+)
MEKSFNDKMLEAANQINVLKHTINGMKEEADSTKKEMADLRDQYEEKSRQKRKLTELYENLKNKYEMGRAPSPSHMLKETSLSPARDLIRSRGSPGPFARREIPPPTNTFGMLGADRSLRPTGPRLSLPERGSSFDRTRSLPIRHVGIS